jgi:hypothetical protein
MTEEESKAIFKVQEEIGNTLIALLKKLKSEGIPNHVLNTGFHVFIIHAVCRAAIESKNHRQFFKNHIKNLTTNLPIVMKCMEESHEI